MKKTVFASLFILLLSILSKAQEKPVYEVKIITSIESIIPNGLGRSRLISTDSDVDYRQFTTMQTEDTGDRNKSDRDEIRIKNYEETKLLNFFNVGGIRFQNIASNDALLTSKINQMLLDDDSNNDNKNDPNGLFITRYYFRKMLD